MEVSPKGGEVPAGVQKKREGNMKLEKKQEKAVKELKGELDAVRKELDELKNKK